MAPESARIGEGVIENRRAGRGSGVLVRFVVVGIVRFQRGEWVRVRKAGGVNGTDDSLGKRVRSVRKGGSGVERGEGVYKN